MKSKIKENTEPLEAELQIDTIDSAKSEPITSEVLEDVADLADDMYDIIFKVGSANIPQEAAVKISEAHEKLIEAYEMLEDHAEDESEERQVTESVEVFDDTKTLKRIRDLSWLGMIDRSAVVPVVRLIKSMHRGENLTQKQRAVAITLLNGLIDVITGDLVYNAARREVRKDAAITANDTR